MNEIVNQVVQLWRWLQQAGNSTIVLVVITAWYTFLTFRIMRLNAVQVREQLRPNLALGLRRSPEDPKEGRFTIENVGERSVKVLDALVTCYVEGIRFSRCRPNDVQGAVLPPKGKVDGVFPISPRTDEWVICTLRVAGSDVGDQVFMTYEYWSNVHKMLVSAHRPIRVVLRMWLAPIRVPYLKIEVFVRHIRRRAHLRDLRSRHRVS
jgi:hypothetical protein